MATEDDNCESSVISSPKKASVEIETIDLRDSLEILKSIIEASRHVLKKIKMCVF